MEHCYNTERWAPVCQLDAPVGWDVLVIVVRRWELRGAANDEDVEARPCAFTAAGDLLLPKCALQGAREETGAALTRPAQLIVAKIFQKHSLYPEYFGKFLRGIFLLHPNLRRW